MISIPPVGPDVPIALQLLLSAMREGVMGLGEPTYPQPVFATTTALRPPASAYRYCQYYDTTINRLAVSDGIDWRRMDTGAAF